MIATKDSVSMPPYPISRVCFSFSSSFGVVPEEMSAWKPDSAPQAMVMNRNGNSDPAKAGPLPSRAKEVTSGICRVGRTMRIPTASSAIVPTFMNVDR